MLPTVPATKHATGASLSFAERLAVAGLGREGGLLPQQKLDVAPVEDRAAVAVGIACG